MMISFPVTGDKFLEGVRIWKTNGNGGKALREYLRELHDISREDPGDG
jgi:hypothetical protein